MLWSSFTFRPLSLSRRSWTCKDTTLTDLLMLQQSAVHVTGLGLELIETRHPAQHPEDSRVVDDGLDPRGPAVLEVLLNPAERGIGHLR